MRLSKPSWSNRADDGLLGQLSVRAIDEWIVRDGIVIVLGLDYSRFIGAGGAHSLAPRIGVQFDANSRTRLTAAYAPGGEESQVQSVAGFEGEQITFTIWKSTGCVHRWRSRDGAQPQARIRSRESS